MASRWSSIFKQAAGTSAEQSYCHVLEHETESLPAPQVLLSGSSTLTVAPGPISSPSNRRVYTLWRHWERWAVSQPTLVNRDATHKQVKHKQVVVHSLVLKPWVCHFAPCRHLSFVEQVLTIVGPVEDTHSTPLSWLPGRHGSVITR